MRNIAISDIHGCNKTFKKLLENIKFSKKDQLYLLGDFIDRGPDSKGVFDTIFNLIDNGFNITCLRGNHEQMLIDAWDRSDFQYTRRWLIHGGSQTVESFNGASIHEIPPKYKAFIHELEYYKEVDNYILVHAGLNFDSNEDPLSLEHSMIWIREWHDQIDYDWLDGRTIIHGHTPIGSQKIKAMFENLDNALVLDIDSGTCFPQVKGWGEMCAFDMTNKKLYFQENIDMHIR